MSGLPKYSLLECERRFLVAAMPETLGAGTLIEDRYIDGTRLRLRRATTPDGVVGAWRLARKYGAIARGVEPMTNLYLTPEEYAVVAALPAATIAKRRHDVMVEGVRFVIDRFAGELAGRAIAEVEMANGEAVLAVSAPAWCWREITGEDAYSGAVLARVGWPE